MAQCPGHVRPITLASSPYRLTAGAFDTPAPLGAAVLSLEPGPRKAQVTGLPGYRPTVITLAWPDMSVPNLDGEDWDWLATRLASLKRDLHVHCRAGHGRTGTCLTLLAHFWGLIPADADCPVAWVREHYCPKAVETKAQIDYVARITGRTVRSEPSLGSAPIQAGGFAPGDRDSGRPWTGQRRDDPYASRTYFEGGGSAADDYRRTTPKPDFGSYFPPVPKKDKPAPESTWQSRTVRYPEVKRKADPAE